MTLKKILIVLCLASTLSLVLSVPTAHSNRISTGQACKKIGERDTYGSKLFVCIKKGKKLVWSKGETLQQASLTLYTTGLLQGDALNYTLVATKGDTCTLDLMGFSKKLQSVSLRFQNTSQIVSSFKTSLDKISRVEVDCEFSEGTVEFIPISSILGPSPTPTRTPSATNSPTPIPTPTSTPTTSSNSSINALPISGKMYWGQYFYEKCWFAKQFRNTGNSVTMAAQQKFEIISADGTVAGYRMFHIPSLQPNQSMWLAEWSLVNQCKSVGRVNEGPIEKRNFLSSPLWNRTPVTAANEIPRILSVVTSPGKWPNTSIYKLRIRNNSVDKHLDTESTEGTKMSLVFLNAQGIPIFAFAGRTMEKVPPLGEATLTAWDFEIGSIELPVGTATIEPGLIFELCRGYTCNY